eukprot:COSAG02_NODE_20783_length_815_cov_3.046089_1_plen_173_part_00
MPGTAWTREGVEALTGLIKRHGSSWDSIFTDAQKNDHLAGRSLRALKDKKRMLDPTKREAHTKARRARRRDAPELREREAAAKRARWRDAPELREREAATKRARRQDDPELREREAATMRARRQDDPELQVRKVVNSLVAAVAREAAEAPQVGKEARERRSVTATEHVHSNY